MRREKRFLNDISRYVTPHYVGVTEKAYSRWRNSISASDEVREEALPHSHETNAMKENTAL